MWDRPSYPGSLWHLFEAEPVLSAAASPVPVSFHLWGVQVLEEPVQGLGGTNTPATGRAAFLLGKTNVWLGWGGPRANHKYAGASRLQGRDTLITSS